MKSFDQSGRLSEIRYFTRWCRNPDPKWNLSPILYAWARSLARLDVHDVGSYSKDQQNNNRNSKVRDRPLEVGMVLTVEPGLYISEQADVPEQYKGIGVRIEDNLLITEYGNKNLTSAVPKEIDEIEN